jgi:methylated-DNA-protein-cysteine methyltransferase related protein
MANSYDRIYAVVRQIPFGKVATYGQVAEMAGLARGARLAGYALFRVPLDTDVPWQRVINAKGEISASPFRQGGDHLQRSILESEGIEFNQQNKINLRKYQWRPDLASDFRLN